MSSLIDDGPEAGENTPEFSVSELSGAVKRTVEGAFGHVRVRGEVGRVSRPRSGHVYLDLKDDRAVLAGIIWKGVAQGLATQPEEGMEVVATGRLTTFPGQSRYQIVIESLAPAGVGALMAMLEKRRRALAAEGLFDDGRKRPLPYLPRRIGVVTSPSGAVIRDILHRLAERFPVHVLVWPVAVQGEKCAAEVSAAIRGFSAMPEELRPDTVIVARGGGSVEDLWGFNEEIVVRAAAESTVPLISAVGHETDTTLIDHAADRRAPTPTAAAEMAVPVRSDLMALMADLQARRIRALQAGIDRRRQRLTDLARALPRPEQLLAERRQRLDLATARLPRPERILADRRADLDKAARGLAPALRERTAQARLRLTRAVSGLQPSQVTTRIERSAERLADRAARLKPAMARTRQQAQDRMAALGRTLSAYSYKATLARGYAVVRDGAGTVIPRLTDQPADGRLEIEFADGRLAAHASDDAGPAAPKPATKAKPKPKPKAEKPDQGTLF
ncbi:MAG: exodeoxyribonuclease VII large subunit [Pseudomonadota bacterium]